MQLNLIALIATRADPMGGQGVRCPPPPGKSGGPHLPSVKYDDLSKKKNISKSLNPPDKFIIEPRLKLWLGLRIIDNCIFVI